MECFLFLYTRSGQDVDWEKGGEPFEKGAKVDNQVLSWDGISQRVALLSSRSKKRKVQKWRDMQALFGEFKSQIIDISC